MTTSNLSHRTLGILGGMGPAATANFHRLLVEEFNRIGVVEDAKFPRIISLNIPLQDWDHHGALNKFTVAQQVRQGIAWLESFGAETIAIPCNSVHEFVDSSSVVNIIDVTLERCKEAQMLGVLCSQQTRDAKLYERNPEQVCIYPANQGEVDKIISWVLEGRRPYLALQIEELFCAGAHTVALGCTELSLCVGMGTFTTIVDSAMTLAVATVEKLMKLNSP